MATTFNTRIKLKYDSLVRWTENDPVLLKGEIAIVEVPNNTEAIQNAPSILMKAGDGVKKFSELPFLTGLAGDVYAWAKAAQKPTYTASEISGLSDYISGEIQDTNTTYKLDLNDGKVQLFAKEIGEEMGTTPVSEITLPTYALTEGSANGTVAFNGADVAVHGLASAAFVETSAFDKAGDADAAKAAAIADTDAKLGALPEGKTVAEAIEDAKKAATYDDTELAGKVSALIGDDASKSARTIANEELAKQLIPANAKDSLDTLQEIAAWIQAHPEEAAAMNQAIEALKTKVGEKSVSDAIDEKIEALDLANTYDAKGTAAAAEAAAKKHADDLAGNYDANGAAAQALADAKADVDTKLEAYDKAAQPNKIESIKVNGVAQNIAEDKSVDLTIHTNIADLEQTSGAYVIFDCGDAVKFVD